MLSIGMWEMVVIAGLALVVVGPERLPKVMRFLGRQYGMLRRAANDMRRAFVLEADRQDAEERYKELQERRERAKAEREAALQSAGDGAVPQDNPLPPPANPKPEGPPAAADADVGPPNEAPVAEGPEALVADGPDPEARPVGSGDNRAPFAFDPNVDLASQLPPEAFEQMPQADEDEPAR
jgi:Tat protein translocase TatB subunit